MQMPVSALEAGEWGLQEAPLLVAREAEGRCGPLRWKATFLQEMS